MSRTSHTVCKNYEHTHAHVSQQEAPNFMPSMRRTMTLGAGMSNLFRRVIAIWTLAAPITPAVSRSGKKAMPPARISILKKQRRYSLALHNSRVLLTRTDDVTERSTSSAVAIYRVKLEPAIGTAPILVKSLLFRDKLARSVYSALGVSHSSYRGVKCRSLTI